MTSVWLKPPEVAALLRVSVGTLANWRSKGIGPRYTKLSPTTTGRVRYLRRDVEAYMSQPSGEAAA